MTIMVIWPYATKEIENGRAWWTQLSVRRTGLELGSPPRRSGCREVVSSALTPMFAGVALMATMPESVTRYLDVAAAEGDIATLLDCFIGDAVVHDEGQTFHGHDEIKRWRETVTSRFTYTVTVLGSEKVSPDRWVVPVRLEGNFPGG